MTDKKIYKYQLEITDRQRLMLPVDSEILTVQMQGAFNLCLWALVDPALGLSPHWIRVCGTGHPINTDEFEVNHQLGR